jgi:hypothetical protein
MVPRRFTPRPRSNPWLAELSLADLRRLLKKSRRDSRGMFRPRPRTESESEPSR